MTEILGRWRPLFGLLALAGVLALPGCAEEPPEYELSSLNGKLPDLQLELPDANGETRTAEDFRGDVVLLFFGYTNCPDVCPMTLSAIRQAVGSLEDKYAERVTVLFVAVDPERDTPEAIREYVDELDMPQLVGLRGVGEEFDTLRDRYHIHVELYKDGPEDQDYEVGHTGGVLIFGPEGKAQLLAKMTGQQPDTPDTLASDLRKLVDYSL
ncbi:MAG: SCO family protein [Thiohalorhabdus sp.]|uniref:SCO family protein n=1 Tax=Thiohalorhabdus sp. TaxID=3094134 RepID=UPI0039804834